MDAALIKEQMSEFERKLHYRFNDISFLAKAMKSVRIKSKGEGKNHKEYTNESMATVGDAILKSIIAAYFYDKDKTKRDITDEKKDIENNGTMHRLMIGEEWIRYSYNNEYFTFQDKPKHKKVVCKEHDPYVEAIVAAIYFDSSSYDITRNWVIHFLLPLLKKYAKKC